MPAITAEWNLSTPADTDALSDGDNQIRNFKLAIIERVGNGGHLITSGGPSTTTTDGRHCAGAALAAGASEFQGEFTIYASDKTTALVIFRDWTAVTQSEVFFGANGLRTTGTLTVGGLSTTGTIKPAADNTSDLGDVTHRYKNAWFTGTVTLTGALVHAAAETFQNTVFFDQTTGSSWQLATGTTTLSTHSTRVVICNPVAGAFTINLPSLASSNGTEFWITIPGGSGGPNKVTINPDGTEQIDATSSLDIKREVAGDRHALHIFNASAQWVILGSSYI